MQLAVVTTTSDGQQQAAGQRRQGAAGGFVQVGSPAAATGSARPAASAAASPAGQVVPFDIASVPQPPGALVTLDARTATVGGTSFEIPVLPASGYYEGSAQRLGDLAAVDRDAERFAEPSANPSGAGRQSPSSTGSATAPRLRGTLRRPRTCSRGRAPSQVARRGRIGLDLGAQPLDVDVEGLGVTDVVRAPHPVDQLACGSAPGPRCGAGSRGARTPSAAWRRSRCRP